MALSKEDKLKKSIQLWRNDPNAWVSDKFPGLRLSTQQRGYLVELGKLIRAKIKVFNHRTGLDSVPPSEEEVYYASLIGISIMAGQGVGKDFMAALTILYMLDVFPYPKITATGITGKHLRNVLWSEISKVMGMAVKCDPNDPQSPSVLEAVLTWQTERVFHKGIKNPGSRWFAEAVTINPHANEEEQAKTLYGRHEDYQLIVVDEAAGVPEPVFYPLEGTLTSKCCIALMIFNPTRNAGYAYNSHYGPQADLWLRLRWNAEESELVTPEHIAKMRRYGVESNTYRVKVLGLPPISGSGGLFPYDKIMAAINREFEVSEFDPIMGAVDPGGGGDPSVCSIRQGPYLRQWQKQTPDPDELSDWAAGVMLQEQADVCFVDNIGLGWYLPKAMRNKRVDARPADFRSTTTLLRPEKFHKKRDEVLWDFSMLFVNDAISIDNDEDLINELGAFTYEEVAGKIKVVDKKTIRKMLKGSPNKVDSGALTCFKADKHFRKAKEKPDKYDLKEQEPQNVSWMGV